MVAGRTLIEEAVTDLSLGYINVDASTTDSDTLQLPALRDYIGATDNRLIEGSYILCRSNVATSFDGGAVTLDEGSDITDTTATFNYTDNASNEMDLETVGDVFTIDSEDMLIIDIVTGSSQVTVIRGYNGTTAILHLDNAEMKIQPRGRWRSVLSHAFVAGPPPADTIELTRPLVGSPFTADVGALDIYFILSYRELTDAVNIALSKLWFQDRVPVTLDDTHNRFSITGTATWLTDPAQLFELKYRKTDSSDSSKNVIEVPVINRLIESDTDVVSVTLYDLPATPADWTLEVLGRHYYEVLATPDSTTTCPQPLARAAVKVEILMKIFNKLGKAAKDNYGIEMAIAEKELNKMKARYRQSMKAMNANLDEEWEGPEVPIRDEDLDW